MHVVLQLEALCVAKNIGGQHFKPSVSKPSVMVTKVTKGCDLTSAFHYPTS